MTGAYRVTIDCGLCTAKVFAEHDDGDEADTLVEQQALAAGFIPLGKVSTAERRRASTWVCKPCAGDVAGAFLEAGRRVQRPAPLPTLDAPGLPDSLAAVGISADGHAVTGLFAGLTQDELAKRGVYTASIPRR